MRVRRLGQGGVGESLCAGLDGSLQLQAQIVGFGDRLHRFGLGRQDELLLLPCLQLRLAHSSQGFLLVRHFRFCVPLGLPIRHDLSFGGGMGPDTKRAWPWGCMDRDYLEAGE